jgi:AraC-like DNA-binding protein
MVASSSARRWSANGEEALHAGREDADAVIIVGTGDVCQRLAKSAGLARVVTFGSLAEFDRWRASAVACSPTIREDVQAVLEETGCRRAMLTRKLRDALNTLAELPAVPAVSMLQEQWPSRRSFYRVWRTRISTTPNAFLRRVRLHHAARLIAQGLSKKEAAHRAGFSSVGQMRRASGK